MPRALSNEYDIVAPEPAALIESLRSVGYTLSTAVADIIDNSIAAGAKNIHITFHWAGKDSYVLILDDGCGMSKTNCETLCGQPVAIHLRRSSIKFQGFVLPHKDALMQPKDGQDRPHRSRPSMGLPSSKLREQREF
jgi:hypothetical protein